MLYTTLTNQEAASDFVRSLSESSLLTASDRPYAGYMVFLLGELDFPTAKEIILALRSLDAITGPYIACFAIIDGVRVLVQEEMGGGQPHERYRPLTIAQIRRLSEGRANHIQLDELATSGNEFAARAFNVVDRVPCVVTLDSHLAKTKQMLVTSLPSDVGELNKYVRSVVHAVQDHKGPFATYAGLLQSAHELHDKLEEAGTDVDLERMQGLLERFEQLIEEAPLEAIAAICNTTSFGKPPLFTNGQARLLRDAVQSVAGYDQAQHTLTWLQDREGRSLAASVRASVVRRIRNREVRQAAAQVDKETLHEVRANLAEMDTPSLIGTIRDQLKRGGLESEMRGLGANFAASFRKEVSKPSNWLKALRWVLPV